MMRTLVIGCNGQLGTELMGQLESGTSELGSIPEIYRNADVTGLDVPNIDICDLDVLTKRIIDLKPDVVFNCAAYTNVDGCESHEDDAYKVNAIGARNLAIACEKAGAKMMHVSTDYVFPGNGSNPYREYDLPQPVSVYGKTKLVGEEYVRSLCSHYFIVRTAWLYGYYGKNFVKAILNKVRTTGEATVVNDQRGNPTNAVDLAYHMLKIAATEEYGVYHCTGNGECSWYDFAREIVSLSEIGATVKPCSSEDYPSPTKRPAYSALDHMMLRLTVGDEMRPWRDALKCFLTNYKEVSTPLKDGSLSSQM